VFLWHKIYCKLHLLLLLSVVYRIQLVNWTYFTPPPLNPLCKVIIVNPNSLRPYHTTLSPAAGSTCSKILAPLLYWPRLYVKVKGKGVYSCLWKSISQLRSVTCHMGSHSVTCHPTQANTPHLHPSQTGWYSIYRSFKGGGLSKPRLRVQRATGWNTQLKGVCRAIKSWRHM